MIHKANFYIDGFNFYHRIKDYYDINGICYKWLNYHSLCKSFLRDGQEVNKVYFFTAVTDYFGKGSSDRHKKYIKALRFYGVEIIQGYFKIEKNSKPKEKQTDVNIAVRLLEDAFTDNYDIAFLLSGDSDLVPAIKAVRRNKPEKGIILVPPPFEGKDIETNRFRIHKTDELRTACHYQKVIHFDYLAKHLLPDKLVDSAGKLVVEKPKEYL